VLAGSASLAQPAPQPAGAAGAPPPRPVVYPPRPVDPAGVERGKLLFSQNGCAGCHGDDTRGGTGGPALHRRALVLNDVRGEKIGPFLLNGRAGLASHAFKLEPPQIVDIADFLHAMRTVGTGSGAIIRRVPSILTGSAPAGQAYFGRTCSGCHSVTGDLAGIGARVTDPRQLQQRWLAPPTSRPLTANVSLPTGPVTGEVTAIDEFSITLKTPTGERVIERDGARPRIALAEPLAAHSALLRRLTDTQIHDVTAYLVTLK
jgi:cytochrome c oxidase cbb3-type subunit 3